MNHTDPPSGGSVFLNMIDKREILWYDYVIIVKKEGHKDDF